MKLPIQVFPCNLSGWSRSLPASATYLKPYFLWLEQEPPCSSHIVDSLLLVTAAGASLFQPLTWCLTSCGWSRSLPAPATHCTHCSFGLEKEHSSFSHNYHIMSVARFAVQSVLVKWRKYWPQMLLGNHIQDLILPLLDPSWAHSIYTEISNFELWAVGIQCMATAGTLLLEQLAIATPSCILFELVLIVTSAHSFSMILLELH